jgi:hypothetical protein
MTMPVHQNTAAGGPKNEEENEMKTRIHLFAVLTVAVLAVSSLAPVVAAQGTLTTSISKAEFKALLKTAKEPSEHHKIADYYRQEAQRLTASSQEHAEMAEFYAKNPPFPRALESKHGDTVTGASHCRKWAELNTDEAKEAESLAALHEDMAKAAEQK